MHFDGSYTKRQGGAGVVLTSPTGDCLKYVVQMHYQGNISNNTTLYEGLLAVLRASIGLGMGKLVIKGDSQLVIKQDNKEYACLRWRHMSRKCGNSSGASAASELFMSRG